MPAFLFVMAQVQEYGYIPSALPDSHCFGERSPPTALGYAAASSPAAVAAGVPAAAAAVAPTPVASAPSGNGVAPPATSAASMAAATSSGSGNGSTALYIDSSKVTGSVLLDAPLRFN